MTDQEKLLNEFPLEGDILIPGQQSRDFKSLSALTDYILVFRIEQGQFGKLQNNNWRLVYNTQNS